MLARQFEPSQSRSRNKYDECRLIAVPKLSHGVIVLYMHAPGQGSITMRYCHGPVTFGCGDNITDVANMELVNLEVLLW